LLIEELEKLNITYAESSYHKMVYGDRDGKKMYLSKIKAKFFLKRLRFLSKDCVNQKIIENKVGKEELLQYHIQKSVENSKNQKNTPTIEDLNQMCVNFYHSLEISASFHESFIEILTGEMEDIQQKIKCKISKTLFEKVNRIKKMECDNQSKLHKLTKMFAQSNQWNNQTDPDGEIISLCKMYTTNEMINQSILDIVGHCAEDNSVQYLFKFLSENKLILDDVSLQFTPFQYLNEIKLIKSRDYCELCASQYPDRISNLLNYFKN
jgi:hypothetical protein